MQVGTNFFDKVFEPSRRDVERQLGTRVSQADFSEMLFKKKINLNLKLNTNLNINGNKKRKNKKA